MACYFGCSDALGKAAWLALIVAFIIGGVFTGVAIDKVVHCTYGTGCNGVAGAVGLVYQAESRGTILPQQLVPTLCRAAADNVTEANDEQALADCLYRVCVAQIKDCAGAAPILALAGLVMFVVAFFPCFYFCCFAVNPRYSYSRTHHHTLGSAPPPWLGTSAASGQVYYTGGVARPVLTLQVSSKYPQA